MTDEGTQAAISLIVIIIGLIGAYFYYNAACNGKAVAFSDHKFGITTGCMVKHKDMWLPLDNIRGFDDKD